MFSSYNFCDNYGKQNINQQIRSYFPDADSKRLLLELSFLFTEITKFKIYRIAVLVGRLDININCCRYQTGR